MNFRDKLDEAFLGCIIGLGAITAAAITAIVLIPYITQFVYQFLSGAK